MLGPFFALAARSPRRQQTLRLAVTLHLLTFLGMVSFHLYAGIPARTLPFLGQTLLVLGIIEGALLLGWRLTQMPKSQSLEFLLVSPVHPSRVLLAEALTGLAQLFFVTVSVAPVLVWLATQAVLRWEDVPMLILHSWIWGAFTGLGLVVWAYEPLKVRQWGERIILGCTIFYLIVGVLAGEKLGQWASNLPGSLGRAFVSSFIAFHRYNPFSLVQDWLTWNDRIYELRPHNVLERAFWVEGLGLLCCAIFLARAMSRLKGHFHERHYSPVTDPTGKNRGRIGFRPLAWWAARRVMEYSGRANIYVAGGFSSIYALYILFENQWPPYLGTSVFVIIEVAMGGLPGIATGLVLLAAVPAAFQYGLWDSSLQERARRMELLLLSELDAMDYLLAAWAAAWRRGRGYVFAVLFLWLAGVISGRLDAEMLVCTLTASGVLWLCYFTMGFWAFARGVQANTLGSLLTLGLPAVAATIALGMRHPEGMVVVPPGFVYAAMTRGFSWAWLAAVVSYGIAGLLLLRWTLRHADAFLRQWYDLNHGKKAEGAA
jgi:hypothetical protein